jgi:hypothetical protein
MVVWAGRNEPVTVATQDEPGYAERAVATQVRVEAAVDQDAAGDQEAPPRRPHGQPVRPSAPAPPRTAAWLAWSILGACVAGTIGGIVLGARNRHLDSGQVLLGVVLLTYPLVGALVAARQPRNPIGWELCALGLCFTLQLVGCQKSRCHAAYSYSWISPPRTSRRRSRPMFGAPPAPARSDGTGVACAKLRCGRRRL